MLWQRRSDPPLGLGASTACTSKEKTLKRGDVIAFLPDDFHHIETPVDSGNALHLHFYGLSLEHLPGRITVDLKTGTAKRFMAKAKILTPLLTVQQVKLFFSLAAKLYVRACLTAWR